MLGDDQQCLHREPSLSRSSVQISTEREFGGDLTDDFFSDPENARFKKRRAESPFTGLASRIGTRFPSFSRKWRVAKADNPSITTSIVPVDFPTSGPASSRSSSVYSRPGTNRSFEYPFPPTPAKSIYQSREDVSMPAPLDIEMANGTQTRDERMATTPLLPPLMMDASANTRQTPMQSPLQSPSVAGPNDPFSRTDTPEEGLTTPQLCELPNSPPLSTKPSISSFHRATSNRPAPAHLVLSSEIPPLMIGDPNDEWANKLGHANFTIAPEPYIPLNFDLEACRQLRHDWDLARCNYTKHLVRTGEHYGVTSMTYKFTEEKWAATEIYWRKNNDLTIANTVENSADAFATLKHTNLGEACNIMTKIPSLNDPRSGGKFPQLGDEDIVGPMVQVAAQLQRTPSTKAKLFRFFVEKFPKGFGKP